MLSQGCRGGVQRDTGEQVCNVIKVRKRTVVCAGHFLLSPLWSSLPTSRALKEVLYPGNSGYYSQTGGNLVNIRQNTTIEKVRAYHQRFYRPENLLLTITGRIDEHQLFEAVRPLEEKILRKRLRKEIPAYERPWQSELKPAGWTEENPEGYLGNHVFQMDYPSDDESKGSVTVAWRLGEHRSASIGRMEAYQLAAKYLTSSQVAPLEAVFVESNDPLATSVKHYSMEYSEPAIGIKFINVPTNRTHEIIPKMMETIQKVIDDGPEKFDIERIHDYINRGLVNNQKENENSPHLFFPDASLADKIYGHKREHFAAFVTASQWTSEYLQKDSSFWIELIKEFVSRKSVAVEAHPSIQLTEKHQKEEEEREAGQIKELGKEGLAAREAELQAALKSQVLPGEDILTKIPLGDVEKIQFRELRSFNRTLNPGGVFDFDKIPFKFHIDDVNSKFVQLYLYLETSGLTVRQKMFLPLLLDVWMSAPLVKDGKIADIGEVIKRVNKVLLKMSISQGHSYIVVGAQAEVAKLKEGLEFIHDRFYHSHITIKELNTTITNRLNYKKPSAKTILSSLFDGLYYDNNSPDHYTDYTKQKRFLEQMREEVKEDVDAVVKEVYDLIRQLVRPERAFLHVAGKAEDLVRLYTPRLTLLHQLFVASSTPLTTTELAGRFEVMPESGYRRAEVEQEGALRHVAMGVDSTKSCYLSQAILYNNTDWSHPEVAAIRVLLRYMSDRLYHEVRGKGLTYSVAMYLQVSTGRLGLKLSKSSQLVEAYNVTRALLQSYIGGGKSFEPALVESAKGALIYSWAEKEETVIGLVKEAARAYTRQADSRYNRWFTKSLAGVEAEDLVQAVHRLLPLFLSPASTITAVVCNKGTIQEVVSELGKFGFEFTTYNKLEDTFLALEDNAGANPRL
jgi:Zn-dependent M16 (insulinase) family peptidase